MKRFTLFAIAALLSVVGYAQKATSGFTPQPATDVLSVKVAPERLSSTVELQNVQKAKSNVQKKAIASVAELEGSYLWDYQQANESATDDQLDALQKTDGQSRITVSVASLEENTVTLSGMFPNDLTATVDLANGQLVIARQSAGTSTYGDYDVTGMFYFEGNDQYDAGWYYSSITGFIGDDGVITFGEWFCRVLVGGQYDGYSLTPYWVKGSTLTPADAPEVVVAPDGLETEAYTISARDYKDSEDVTGSVFVGFDGTDVYIQGLCSYIPESWAKGTLADGKVTFAPNQYFGNYSGYDMFLNSLMGVPVVLDYDAQAGTLTAENEFFLVDNSQYYFDSYRNAVFTKYVPPLDTPWEGAAVGEGDFYLYNPESGLWLQNNNMQKVQAWTTRAEVDVDGMPFELVAMDGGYRINTYFAGNHSLNASNLYMDTPDAVTTWVFTPSNRAKNAYTITSGNKALGVDENGNISDVIAGVWQLVTKEERLAALAEATAEAPVNATWLIEANSFPANYEKNAAWQRTGDAGGFNIGGDWWENPNRVLETWALKEADVFQEIKVPNGVYELQVAGVFSPTPGDQMNADHLNQYIAGTLPNYGWFYANNEFAQMPSIYSEYRTERTPDRATREMGGLFVPDGVNQVSRGITDGLYKSDVIKVVVTDGKLRVGAKVFGASTKTNWIIIDNFRLTYFGEAPAEAEAEEGYDVDPAEGRLQSLSTINITFDNGVTLEGDPKATLLNIVTGEQQVAPIYTVGSSRALITFEEQTTTGKYEVIIPAGALRNTNDNSLMPAMSFDYSIINPYDLVTPPANLKPEVWTIGGAFQVGSFNEWSDTNVQFEPQELAKKVHVGFDGDDVYIQGLGWFDFLNEGWIKGTITGEVNNDVVVDGEVVTEGKTYKVITFPGVQYQGNVGGKDYWLLATDISKGLYQYPDEVNFLYDDETGRIWPAKNNTLLSVNGKYDKFFSYGYYQDYTIRRGAEVTDEVVEVPETADVQEFYFSAFDNYYQEVVSRPVKVAIDGEDIYINGVSELFEEDGWVKGKINGDKVTVEAGQYLGQYLYMGFFPIDIYFDPFQDVVFDYDAAAGKLTCANGYSTYSYTEPEDESSNGFDAYDEYTNVTIQKIVEKAATPADPEITEVRSTDYGDILIFNIPLVDTDGNPMLTSKLTYRIFSSVGGTESPVTFVADPEIYQELEEDMTDIPYGFTEEWDFYPNAIYLNLDHSDWDKVGIQTTYNGGGESHSSNLEWFEITQNANPTGINEVNADSKDAKVFNLQGVQLKKMQRGINIVNGKKVVRK
ncbi:MAG: hypothetical protein IJ539_07480 [Prevotella sp.]|nr:hypothetical protein [Prevotella sp.]